MTGRRWLPAAAAVASTWIGLAACASEEPSAAPPVVPELTLYLALGASDAAGIGARFLFVEVSLFDAAFLADAARPRVAPLAAKR